MGRQMQFKRGVQDGEPELIERLRPLQLAVSVCTDFADKKLLYCKLTLCKESFMNMTEFSVIIPALNEEEHIGGVIDSIRTSVDGCFRYEVIVVDNGSSDRTVEIAQKNGAICFQEPGGSISFIRNLGALQAKSDIIVFLDSDVYLQKGWGERIGIVIDKLRNQPQIISGSFCGISEENNWIEQIWFTPRTNSVEKINYMNSGHLIVHRSLFSKVGGFDPNLETGEDYDFCTRARGIGALIENDPKLKVMHAGYPKCIRRFFIRERWHARGDYRSLKALVSSKPALISFSNLFMAVTCLIGTIIHSQDWFVFLSVYILFLTSVSLVASIHRFRGRIDTAVWGAAFLYMVFFTARTLSIFDVVIKSLIVRSPRTCPSLGGNTSQ